MAAQSTEYQSLHPQKKQLSAKHWCEFPQDEQFFCLVGKLTELERRWNFSLEQMCNPHFPRANTTYLLGKVSIVSSMQLSMKQ